MMILVLKAVFALLLLVAYLAIIAVSVTPPRTKGTDE